MAIVSWEDVEKINVGLVDAHHKKLFQLINELHLATSEGKGQERMGQALQELLDYTVTHFKYEEEFQRKKGFPKCDLHKVLHDGFTKKVHELNEQYKAGTTALSVKAMKFLNDWLVNHIGKCDTEYRDFFKANNIKI